MDEHAELLSLLLATSPGLAKTLEPRVYRPLRRQRSEEESADRQVRAEVKRARRRALRKDREASR